MSTPSKSFDVAASGSTVLYFRGHPQYDAVRVEFDGSSTSADTDVTYKTDPESEVDVVESAGFGSMANTVQSTTALDPSSGATDGTDALARTVAVEINEQGTTGNAAGTVKLHSSSDPAENAANFANK